MNTQADLRQSTSLVGLILIVVGAVVFVVQVLGYDVARYGWPLIVVGVGVVLLATGLVGIDRSRGLVYPGMIVTTVGLILLYQSTFNDWKSWAYMWALIPASVGLATALHATLTGHPERVRGGLSTFSGFVVVGVLGLAFFEGILHISGRDLGLVGEYLFPLLLVAAGVLILISRATWDRWEVRPH